LKFFKKTDIIIVLAIVAVSAVVWMVYNSMFSDRPAKAEIYYYSKLVMTIDLVKGKERSFSVPQEQDVVFHIDKEGNIGFEKSDCPDKICIHAGMLQTVGQSAACLPNGLVLKIVPANKRNDDDLDAVG
jgi:hypothetical protein